MPKTRKHAGKLATKPAARDVARAMEKIDPKLDAVWKKLLHKIEDAETRGAEAYDELWEAVSAAVHHNPPLYVLGGYKSATDFFQRLLHTDLRSATRNMLVAKYASPKEEEQYGTSNIYAAIEYLEAKVGHLGQALPIAFDRLKIALDGKSIPFTKATFDEISRATRALQRKSAGEPATDRTEAAIAKVMSKHAAFKNTHISVRAGLVHVRGIPIASLDLFARVLSEVKMPPVELPAKKK